MPVPRSRSLGEAWIALTDLAARLTLVERDTSEIRNTSRRLEKSQAVFRDEVSEGFKRLYGFPGENFQGGMMGEFRESLTETGKAVDKAVALLPNMIHDAVESILSEAVPQTVAQAIQANRGQEALTQREKARTFFKQYLLAPIIVGLIVAIPTIIIALR